MSRKKMIRKYYATLCRKKYVKGIRLGLIGKSKGRLMAALAVHTLERTMNRIMQGAAMKEYELEVLEQYDMEVKSTRRIRGAFFCDRQRAKVRACRRLWRLLAIP